MKNTISLRYDLDSSLDYFNNEITDNNIVLLLFK